MVDRRLLSPTSLSNEVPKSFFFVDKNGNPLERDENIFVMPPCMKLKSRKVLTSSNFVRALYIFINFDQISVRDIAA